MAKRTAFDYVALLVEKGTGEVVAIKLRNFPSKYEARASCWDKFPDWNVKIIERLYEEDWKE